MQQTEKGFTLIEVLISLAIIGIITLAMTMTVTALLTQPQKATDRDVVLQQVQNAGYWISRDVQMAKYVTLTEPNGFPLTLDIPFDADVNNDYSIDYLLDGNNLKRRVYDSSGTQVGEITISQYIDVSATTFCVLNPDNPIYNFSVKASMNGIDIERNYSIKSMLISN